MRSDSAAFTSLSTQAGACAAKYIAEGAGASEYVDIGADGGVRYAVPQRVRRGADGALGFKMRVGKVAKNVKITLFCDGKEVAAKRKQIVTPGEMETLNLNAAQADVLRGAKEAVIRLTEV